MTTETPFVFSHIKFMHAHPHTPDRERQTEIETDRD